MKGRVVHLSKKTRKKLRHRANKTKDRYLWRRYQIILRADEGKSPTCIARELDCSRPTVYAAIKRWCAYGEAGLIDRREDNRPAEKITEEYRSDLVELVEKTPRDYGKRRPSWRLSLLSEVMEERTGIKISNSQLSRVLRGLGARWGRSRPIVLCPWKKAARNRRIGRLKSLASKPPAKEVVVYEDEVDVHLNPKIGYDWMMRGQQKEVVTPGQNVKNYIAGALEATTGKMVWVRGERKNSLLFIDLLRKLLEVYSDANRIHIILDRYSIHSSEQVKLTLKSMGRRIKLHLLPPYCPDANLIERKWEDFHADVTTNHQHDNIDDLMADAEDWLQKYAA